MRPVNLYEHTRNAPIYRVFTQYAITKGRIKNLQSRLNWKTGWLKSRGDVDEDEDNFADVADTLFAKGFNRPMRLLGITSEILKEPML